ncbi:MAG: hypothetical protein KJ558_16755, partial [Gammaproteobacteria bacterium]|nr:hypothetical protein [Gammaproteobacteria bacterium]MBU1656443.1 hypothetical protein [Gammaproteobacteria bacterium]MBU1962477.1 hypothetical protein [Gammaproteobacteria bacterium]
GVPKAQKRPPAPPLERFMAEYANRDEGIAAAYATGEYSYQQIADRCGFISPPLARLYAGRGVGIELFGRCLKVALWNASNLDLTPMIDLTP